MLCKVSENIRINSQSDKVFHVDARISLHDDAHPYTDSSLIVHVLAIACSCICNCKYMNNQTTEPAMFGNGMYLMSPHTCKKLASEQLSYSKKRYLCR